MALTFYTIGHSTRTIPEFVNLLQVANVNLVVDIRHIPKSRSNPHYNQDQLPTHLNAYNIGYQLIEELGGLRNRNKKIDPKINSFWTNQSFHNYADYTLTKQFQAGINKLTELTGALKPNNRTCCALMCSEAVWWRCHRRIVADVLLAHGDQVFHLMGKDKIVRATLTEGAQVEDGKVIYPSHTNVDINLI